MTPPALWWWWSVVGAVLCVLGAGCWVARLLALTRQVDQHPALLVGLRHTGVLSLDLRGDLLHLPEEQTAEALEHDC